LGRGVELRREPALAPTTGCAAAPGFGLPQGVAISPGGTLYVASFLDYTHGSLVALPTLGDGSLGTEIDCVETMGYASGTCPTKTTWIASATNVVVGPQGVYVTSSEYQAIYGEVTAFSTDPGGGIAGPLGCVGSSTSTCANVVPGLLGARGLAISSDSRLPVAGSPIIGASGTLAAFPLQSFRGFGAELGCFGSAGSTGCTPAAGLRGADAVLVTNDGTIYVASNFGDSDGGAAAFSRQPSGALASEINCVGVTRATGCGVLTPGLEHAVAIAGSPDPNTQDIYIGSQFAFSGTDGSIAQLTRELAPVCADGTASTTSDKAVMVPMGCSDPNLDPLTISAVASPAHGTLGSIDQTTRQVRYTPKSGYVGSDSFTLYATDGTLTSGTASETITISPAVASPIAPTPPIPPTPRLSGLALRPASFPAASTGASISRRQRATGTTVRYNDTVAARTTLTVLRTLRGVRSGKRCVKAPRHRTHRPKSWNVTLGSFSHSDTAGINRFHFSGRVNGKALKPGAYTLNARPRAGSKTGKTATATFSITT
jgi:hypothetical protein